MKQSSYSRRAFIRLGAGVAAGAGIAVSAEKNTVLAKGLSAGNSSPASNASATLPTDNSTTTDASPASQARKTLRPFGPFLANHNQDTGLHFWGIDRWKREIADSKQMGARAIWYLPFQFGQRTRRDFEDMAPHWTLQRAICRAIVDAGLEVGIYQGLNDIFPETWGEHPEWQATAGDYSLEEAHACPSVPEAHQEMLRLRDKLYAGLPRLDYVVTQITDYGGCGCDMCTPYPKTYMRVLEEQSALAKRYHPEVKIVPSAMSSTVADMNLVRDLLGKATWADYVYEVPRGPKPAIKSLLPETTMVGGWGKFGPCPLLPDIKRDYEYDLPHIGGVAQYCEGIHDDVNRFAVLQFAENPQRSLDDVARQYAEDWLKLNGHDAALVAQVIPGLGTPIVRDVLNALGVGSDNPHGDDRVKILLDVRSRSHALEDNYRYWLLLYRAICESFGAKSGPLSLDVLRKEGDDARESLLRLEPEYGRFLTKQAGWEKPGHLPTAWPRSVNALWKYENSFVS